MLTTETLVHPTLLRPIPPGLRRRFRRELAQPLFQPSPPPPPPLEEPSEMNEAVKAYLDSL